jgi:gamma-glutamyl-gamma-aminobutyrate hydrolase PuuD
MKTSFLLITAILTLSIPIAAMCSGFDEIAMNEDDGKNELHKLVHDYVESMKGWEKGSYSIQLNRKEGDVTVFWVLHEKDNDIAVAGGGKSFEVHVNVDERKVVRELGFQ